MDYLSFTKTAKLMLLKDLYEHIQLRMFCFGVQANTSSLFCYHIAQSFDGGKI